MKTLKAASAAVATLLSTAVFGVTVDSTTVDYLLGPGAIVEHFETYTVNSGSAANIGSSTLDASTVGFQGPGLVEEGFRLLSYDGQILWVGENTLSNTTKAVRTLGGFIDFTTQVNTFGFGFQSSLAGDTSFVIFGEDDTTILETVSDFSTLSAYELEYFGYTSDENIGGVLFGMGSLQTGAADGVPRLNNTNSFNGYIMTDDLSFGVSSVPAPAAFWLFGSGLLGLIGAARRKKAV